MSKKITKSPYSDKKLLLALGALIILVSIPLTVILSSQRPSLAPQAATQSITLQVSAGNDDAYQFDWGSQLNLNDSYVRMDCDHNSQGSFATDGVFRFRNVTIPPGSTINSASLQLYVRGASYDNPQVDIFGEKVANGGDFATKNILQRGKTSASVGWAASGIGAGYKSSPDIKNVIAEIMNQGWASGYALVIIVDSRWCETSYNAFWAGSFEGGPSTAAKLSITYSPPAPPCSDECSANAKQCTDGTHYKTCGNYDADSCLEWSPITACTAGQTCTGGACSPSGGGSAGGKKSSGGGGAATKYLETLQMQVSVTYLVGKMNLKIELSGAKKELEVSSDKKDYSLDLKGTNLSLNKEYSLIITSDKTLVKKVKFTPTASSTNVSVGDLILGDLNQDNKIDSADQLELIDSISAQTSLGDLNADQDIDSLDWAILLTNFGKKGD